MGKKKNYDYFEALAGLVKISCRASKYLEDTLENFGDGIGEKQMEEAHAIEHEGDERKHEVMNHLLKEFIPPLDREDIVGITQRIDDVTDALEDVLLKMYMFHVVEVRPESQEFASLILRCCESLKAVMKEFHHFKKPAKLGQLMIEVHELESEGDALYTRAMRRLFENSSFKEPAKGQGASAVELIVWTELFRRMELCLDAMEQVVDLVESVIMKNS